MTFYLGRTLICLADSGMKSTLPIFRTEMFIFQSKANLDVKIVFDKITHHLEPEISKC